MKLLNHMESLKSDMISAKNMEKIITLEKGKTRLLAWKEVKWKMESCFLWLSKGENNEIFFHGYALGKKAINDI